MEHFKTGSLLKSKNAQPQVKFLGSYEKECIWHAVPETVAQRCSVKEVFLEVWPNSLLCQSFFFNEVAGWVVFLKKEGNFVKKETLALLFSCEFYKISNKTFSYITPPVAASAVPNKRCIILICPILTLQHLLSTKGSCLFQQTCSYKKLIIVNKYVCLSYK